MRQVPCLLIACLILYGCSGQDSRTAPRARVNAAMPGLEEDANGTALLFAFRTAAERSLWQSANDESIGGASQSWMTPTSHGTVIFAGRVQTGAAGGFASILTAFGLWDVSDYEGLEIRIRGDGNEYNMGLKTNYKMDPFIYASPFTANQEWTVIRLPFSSFVPQGTLGAAMGPALDTHNITAFGILIASRSNRPFHLEVEHVKLYRTAGSPQALTAATSSPLEPATAP